MMARSHVLFATVFVTLLQGCMTTYVAAPDEKMVTVRSVGAGRPQLCKDGKLYWAPEASGVPDGISVPAGQRLTLGSYLSSSGYQVIHYCRPFLSFVPEPGKSYVMNAALDGDGRCAVELVREDVTRNTGVAVEPSIGRPVCFQQ